MEIVAMIETVIGNPIDCGHLIFCQYLLSTSRQECIPIKAIYIKHLRNPHQSRKVIEPIIHKQEEPKVHLHPRISMSRGPMSVPRTLIRRSTGIIVLWKRVLRERKRTPNHHL
jgi:hypothetical protein